MINPEEYFGKCLAYNELEEPIRDLYELGVDVVNDALAMALIENDGKREKYPFSIGFPIKNTFNAGTCDCDEGGSIVAINAAVPYLLFNACLTYSTRVDVQTALPKERDGKLIVFDEKLTIKGRLQYMPHKPTHVFQMFEKLITSSENKGANLPYALHLYEIALRYIAMHEVMHIILGHTSYIKHKLSLNLFLEFSSVREECFDHQFSHCLEFLSDRNAVRGIARKMLDGDYRSEAQQTLLGSSIIPQDTYILRSIVTAITIVFHLFPNRDDSLKSPIYTHPNPYLRMQWITMELGHEFGESVDFRSAILTPLAHTGAAMYANFQTPNNWKYSTEEDIDPSDGGRPKFSDDSYKQILEESGKWGDKLWKEYSPIYKNDKSGRFDD